jgi:CheY-like chemotaxis protein
VADVAGQGSVLDQQSMRILIAEDDAMLRHVLQSALVGWGYEVVVAADSGEAWRELQRADAPPMAVLDWMMPELDGPEVCRRVRELGLPVQPYLVLLTSRGASEDIVSGLEAGADDYIIKPFQREELRARVHVGVRVVELQRHLADRVKALEEALAQVKQLQGMLPICSWCKKIRDDQNYWQQIETYLSERSEAQFTHSICPDCREKYIEPQLEKYRREREAGRQ